MVASIVLLIALSIGLCTGALPSTNLPSAQQFPVRFMLYTPRNPFTEQVFTYPAGANTLTDISKSNFNSTLPTKIIINGYLDDPDKSIWTKAMRDEFLHVSNCNVIFVDWSAGNGGNYDQAHANTRIAAQATTNFIMGLQNLKGLSLSKVHIIGHSLGAHTSGFVGHAFNGQIGRITGLDPAGPGFNGMPATDKLNPTNAQFVDAIHSDAVLNIGAGIVENSGHVDFWPDNGKNHPGCTLSWLTSIFSNMNGFQGGLTCNHFRAVDFYAASINPNNPKGVAHQCRDYSAYLAGECDTDCAESVANCAIIGEQAVLSKPYESSTIGKRYYLSTNPSYPYFQG